ncbi:MAG: hypothetical protein HC837_20670 [Chloroflexaceae bacterium]|nr:hypothetical protein [Chloroflexaceae bacterium]
MKLPNYAHALVEQRKITTYLLAAEHPAGKAAFFAAFGFTRADWHVLRDALLHHAATHEVAATLTTPHGVKFIIEGAMPTPDGRSPQVGTVWIVATGSDTPRLVTAYPLTGDLR